MRTLAALLVIAAITAGPVPRSAPEPAPIGDEPTGIEQGSRMDPAAPERTAALEYRVVAMAPQPTNGTQPAWEGTPVTAIPSPGHTLRGIASWYRTPGLTAAAGPALRRAIGRWRGARVVVCAGECVAVTLTDWCQCHRGERSERVIDLSDEAFSRLAPLAAGLVRVRIERLVPPATDAEP